MTREELEKLIDDIAIHTQKLPIGIKMTQSYLQRCLLEAGLNYRVSPRDIWAFQGLQITIDNNLTTGFEMIYEDRV